MTRAIFQTEAIYRSLLRLRPEAAQVTEQTLDVLVFIISHLVETQRVPSMREICERFDWASKTAAHKHCHTLAQKGFLIVPATLNKPYAVHGLKLIANLEKPCASK